MNEADQDQAGGLSRSEKILLVRAVIFGLIASLLTLWLGGMFGTAGPSLLSLEVVLAGLFSLLVAVLVSIMGESVIEDLVKLVMFILLWWFSRRYGAIDLVALGMLIGGVAGFLNNRLPKYPCQNKR